MIIVLDGMDATYKSTIARKLQNYGFTTIRFPYYREEVNKKLLHAKSIEEKAQIFFEDMKKVIIKIDKNNNYVFDRSFVSTFLYQGIEISEKEKIPYEEALTRLYNIMKNTIDYTNIIDQIFILTVSDNDYLNRTINRDHIDNIDEAYDKLDFQRKIREKIPYVTKFLIEHNLNVTIIDTSGKSSDKILEKEILPRIT